MSFYETTIVARQDISQHDADKIADTYIQLIETYGGKLLKREYWGILDLAYVIKKNRKGHYYFLCFDANIDAINEMQRLMGINEDIIRTLVIKVKAVTKEPSPMMNRNKYSEAATA